MVKTKFKDGTKVDESIVNSLPKDVLSFIQFVIKRDFELVLVGGSVRDFILNEAYGLDFDFEITHSDLYSDEAWAQKLEDLYQDIKTQFDYNFELGSFKVLKARYKTLDIEIAPAREEKYRDGDLSHKNFEAIYLTAKPYSERAARRDFTINSLGIEFKENTVTFLDPFHGVEHLLNKELENCGSNFDKDPVRFLRAIRFMIKFDLELTKQLKDQMRQMNIEKVSAHYFNYEANKVGYNTFFLKLTKISNELGVKIPKAFQEMKVNNLAKSSKEQFIFSLLIQNELEKVKDIADFLGFSDKLLARMNVLHELCFNFGALDKNNIIKNHKLTDHAGHIYQIFQVYKNEGRLFEELAKNYKELSSYLELFYSFKKKDHQLTVDFCRDHQLDQSHYGTVGLLLNLNLL
ncbi:MAG: CCA tRNA nucleotidyltransferase [Oligoflexia bacterium]|nr:CCA tRNA nucleotidyltransferase [Oligoflexia bacterium]